MAIRQEAQRLLDFSSRVYGISGPPVDPAALIEKWGKMRGDGFLEHPCYKIVGDRELPGRAAEFQPRPGGTPEEEDGRHIFIFRESVWDLASAGDPEARETLAHEIGHCVMRHPPINHARTYKDERVDWQTDSEWQANKFRDEFLVDSRGVQAKDSWGVIANIYNVTEETAVRLVREFMNERLEKKRR